MRAGLLVVAVLALIGFVAVAFVLPQMAGAQSREAAQALIAGADGAQKLVAVAAEKSGALQGAGKDVKLQSRSDAKHGELKWIVSEAGVVRGWNEKNAIEVTLTPSLQGGKVAWACKGYPSSAMPGNCGGH